MTKPSSLLFLACASLGSALTLGCGDSGTTSTGGTTSGGSDCAPDAGCPSVTSDCIAFTDNAGKDDFALRISHLSISQPTALTDPTIANLLGKGVNLAYPECKAATGDSIFTGDGTFSWIFEFNKTTGKLTAGGAVLEADPTKGYCFVNETIDGFMVQPFVADAPIGADGSFEVTDTRDVVVPIYTTPGDPNTVILLPLKGVRLYDAKVSTDNNCIGTYNPDLDPNNLCLADSMTPQFIDGASLDGYVTLEDADAVKVPVLSDQSLCTLLVKDPQYIDATGKLCKRDANNKIVYEGDWCAGAAEGDPGTPATATCKDAVQLKAKFAASGAILRTDCP